MRLIRIAVAFIITIISLNVYLYLENKSITREITRADQACAEAVAILEKQYEEKINKLIDDLAGLPKGVNTVERGDGDISLDKMVSYGHQFRAVSHKYEFLLESAQITVAEKKRLSRLLVEREKLHGIVVKPEMKAVDKEKEEFVNRLTNVEENIKDLLKDPTDYERYNQLKAGSL
jgi:phage host-nuclease inhibitor protein Gam